MKRSLPPLNALRAFEAAARHLSFTKAADELHVTQAAISHQIKTLEEALGVKLFRRMNRSLLLSDDGQVLLPHATAAFDRLAAGIADLRRRGEEGVLTITTIDSLASTWLVPRLGRFRSMNPDIDVRVTIADRIMDLGAEGIDVGIRYGPGSWPGVDATWLMGETLFPVCAPWFADQHNLKAPDDLRNVTLLHDDMPLDWEDWLEAAGCPDVPTRRGPGYTHSNLVTISACAGEGVALGRSVLVAEDLAVGRLVRLFEVALPSDSAYYVVTPAGRSDPQKVNAFREWLLMEASALEGNPLIKLTR